MSNILAQEIIEGNFNKMSIPAVRYGEYGGIYDENIDYINAVGIGSDNNIYLAKSYQDLMSLRQNESYIRYSMTGITTIEELIYGMEFLLINLEGVENTSEIYVKDYRGYVLPIKEIAVDEVGGRIMFVTDYVEDN